LTARTGINVKTKLSRVSQRINNIKFAVFIYLLTSALLSFMMFLRLEGLSFVIIKYANILLYFLFYLGGSLGALYYLISAAIIPKTHVMSKQPSSIFRLTLISTLASLILVVISFSGILPDYIFLIIPVLLACTTYIAWLKPRGDRIEIKHASVIVLLLVFSILLPNITVFGFEDSVVSQVAKISSPTDKVQYVAGFVQNIPTFNLQTARANDDFWKYLLVGTGACHETAMATVTLLRNLGFEARIVVLPGEDHAFVEVKIDGTWLVVDPGYNITEPVTRKQRADMRIQEMGAISYVVTYSDSSFIELTSFYAPTDTITIKVTRGQEPIANAQVYLLHKFMNGIQRLPGADTSFFTDGNGETAFHMGALAYNENAKDFDTCYWIYVNGKSTGYNVTSTGTGTTHLIEIDLADA
jgi:hypothetical protein